MQIPLKPHSSSDICVKSQWFTCRYSIKTSLYHKFSPLKSLVLIYVLNFFFCIFVMFPQNPPSRWTLFPRPTLPPRSSSSGNLQMTLTAMSLTTWSSASVSPKPLSSTSLTTVRKVSRIVCSRPVLVSRCCVCDGQRERMSFIVFALVDELLAASSLIPQPSVVILWRDSPFFFFFFGNPHILQIKSNQWNKNQKSIN